MLSVDEVWALIDREVTIRAEQPCPLVASLGRRLAEDVRADEDQPAFTRSAIDGFFVPEGSQAGRFRIVGEVRPGQPVSSRALQPGETMKIFTGSALPDAGVALVMVEDARMEKDEVIFSADARTELLRHRGTQARAGDILLSAGHRIEAGSIALLASVGRAEPRVSPQITATHFASGSELVPVSEVPPQGFIRDSNSPLVAALLAEAGAKRIHHVCGTESIDEAVKKLQPLEADLLLISGGASVGAHDGTAEILRQLGFEIRCAKVKSRPGKPLIFATRGEQAAFGLPGNPLSHFVCFQLFVRRVIDRMTGFAPRNLIKVQLSGPRPPADARETWWPARVGALSGGLVASALPWRDSSDLTGLPGANALLRIPSGETNELVETLLFGTLGT